jgi:DNA mismatch endonuclease (patch repair protein)
MPQARRQQNRAKARAASVSPVPSYAGFQPASEAASKAKRANRREDTADELLLRRAIWRLGLRYRKHVPELPGKPDFVFRQARVVVFCDGDSWHGRDWARLRRQLARRHNADYWIAKIARNRKRDAEHTRTLARAGWLVVRLWETDIKQDPGSAALTIQRIVHGRAPGQAFATPECVGVDSPGE